MKIPYTQGLLKGQIDNPTNRHSIFLTKTGNFINLNVTTIPFMGVIAHKAKGYLVVEQLPINKAWGPLPAELVWLYIDINIVTGEVTRGFTTTTPTSGTSLPTITVSNAHFYKTDTRQMFVYENSHWVEKLRLFVGQVSHLGIVTPLPFASQVGLDSPTEEYAAGYIVYDSYTGKAIVSNDGTFLTSDSNVVVKSTQTNFLSLNLEKNPITVIAGESIPACTPIYISNNVAYASRDPSGIVYGVTDKDSAMGDLVSIISNGSFTHFKLQELNLNGLVFVDPLEGLTSNRQNIHATLVGYMLDDSTLQVSPRFEFGYIGPEGPTGPMGPTGPANGPIGPTGLTGVTGPTGLPGPTGPNGNDGLTGPTGSIGLSGATGPRGISGVTGPTGPLGLSITGPMGPTGNDGLTIVGPTGPRGFIGNVGPTGPIGEMGPTGPIGLSIIGPTGPRGNIGLTGPTGPTGFGEQGVTGPTGPRGYIGNTGPTGPRGQEGIGIQGEVGPTGPRGFIGPTGPFGPTGPAGSNAKLGGNVDDYTVDAEYVDINITDTTKAVMLTMVRSSTLTLNIADNLDEYMSFRFAVLQDNVGNHVLNWASNLIFDTSIPPSTGVCGPSCIDVYQFTTFNYGHSWFVKIEMRDVRYNGNV